MEQAAEAVSSPAMEVDRGPLVNLTGDQRAEFRRTGQLPEAPKEQPKEESAPSDPPKEASEAEKPEAAAESEPAKKQKSQTGEERKAQLTAEIKELLKQREAMKAEIATPKAEPKAVEAPKPEPIRPKPTVDAKDKDGNPAYQTYEDYVEDLADWKAEQRIAAQAQEQRQQAQQRVLESKIAEGKAIYGEDFGKKADEAAGTIMGDAEIPILVKQRFARSEMLPHLVYTLADGETGLADFAKMAKSDVFKALDYITLTESLIHDELEKKASVKETPAKPVTQAPKPPAEVGGRAATPSDQLVAAAQANDFRSFKNEANRRAIARMKA